MPQRTDMNEVVQAIFNALPSMEIYLIGSFVTSPTTAHDIDILFVNEDEFYAACEFFSVAPQWWSAYTGRVSRANLTDMFALPVQLIHNRGISSISEFEYHYQQRDGTIVLQKAFDKTQEGWRAEKSMQLQQRRELNGKTLAIDFDGTIRSWDTNKPLEGAREALCSLREQGHRIVIHSCNSKQFIEDWMHDHGIPFDFIFEKKPIANYYIDDRAIAHTSWEDTMKRICS